MECERNEICRSLLVLYEIDSLDYFSGSFPACHEKARNNIIKVQGHDGNLCHQNKQVKVIPEGSFSAKEEPFRKCLAENVNTIQQFKQCRQKRKQTRIHALPIFLLPFLP
jgi:hypothetical protein